MSAMSSGRLRVRRPGWQRRATRHSVTLTLAAVAALSLVAFGARAEDGRTQRLARLPSADGTNPSPWRLGVPPRPAGVDVDLQVLLAQNGPPAMIDAANADDTILVAVALAVPHVVDEDIAKRYGLELVERTELANLGLRIVQFRVPGNRPIGPILTALGKDPRIRRAQRNAYYGLPPEGAPTPEIAAAVPNAKTQATVRSRSARKADATMAQNRPGPAAAARRGPSPSAPPLRVGSIGDVLSGGL